METMVSPGGGGSEGSTSAHSPTTPTRRNKRKMTEPKRRTSDFSIKRFCPDTDTPPESPRSLDDTDEPSSPRCAQRTPETAMISVPRGGPSGSAESSDQSPSPPATSGPPETIYPIHVPSGAYLLAAMPGCHPAGVTLPFSVPIPGLPRIPTSQHHPEPSTADPCTSDGQLDEDQNQDQDSDSSRFKKPRKNYKNMTRERRVEANARERSRVHTISAAFDSLRRAVPSYSYNQKLSKLAILRIACSYILALARLVDMDYAREEISPTFADCVDMCTNTIQTEGRARRRH